MENIEILFIWVGRLVVGSGIWILLNWFFGMPVFLFEVLIIYNLLTLVTIIEVVKILETHKKRKNKKKIPV